MPPTKPAAKQKKTVRIAKHPRPVTAALITLQSTIDRLPFSSPRWLLDELVRLEGMLVAMDASTGKPDAARTRHARKR